MTDAILATIGWLVVAWLPGVLLCVALRPTAGFFRNASLAVPVGLALTMLVGLLWSTSDIAVTPASVLPGSLGVPAIVAVAAFTLRTRRAGRHRVRAGAKAQTSRPDRLALVASVVVGIGLWSWAIPSLSAVIPFIDGSHHGLFASRIETLHTLEPHRVLSADLVAGHPSYNYYPLALHLCVALISPITGVPVNQVFVVGVVLAGSILLPLGTFTLLRWLLPEQPTVARVAAILSAAFPLFPYSPLLWGGVALIVAMCQVPGAVEAACNVSHSESRVATGVLFGLAGYGLFQEHNTELVTVVLFAVIVMLARRWASIGVVHRRQLTILAIAVVVDLGLVLPLLHVLSGGVTERTGNLGHAHGAGLSLLEWVLGAGNPAIVILALVGLAVSVRRRWLIPWIACLAVTALLLVTTLPNPAILPWLTVAWYSSASRLSYLFAYFETAFAAVAVALIVERLRRRAAERTTRADRLVVRVPLAGMAAVLMLVLAPVAIVFVRAAYTNRSLVGADQRAAFAWLASHVRPHDRVLNQFNDDSAWMATLDGVTPVFAVDPVSLGDPQAAWGDRWYLLTHAGALSHNTRAQAAVRRWHVTYVYVGSRVFTSQPRRLFVTQLQASPAYREVWHQGSATIFAVLSG